MILAAFLLLASVFVHFLPEWTRPGLFFSVTVDPAFRETPAARRIIRFYRAILWSSAFLAIALFSATNRPVTGLVQAIGYLCALALARRRTLAHAVPANSTIEVNLVAPKESLPGGMLAIVLPFAALVALALWASRNWDRLPQRFPVHLGVNGPNRWILRTPAGFYGMLGVDAAVSLVFVLIAVGILHWSRRESTGGVAVEERGFRRANLRILLLCACLPPAEAWIVVIQPAAMSVWLTALVMLVAAVYYTVLIRNRPRLGARAGDHTPDSCWKLGIFYINPADPALFVLRRFGIGYTFNFGNRWSWAALATVLTAVSLRAVIR